MAQIRIGQVGAALAAGAVALAVPQPASSSRPPTTAERTTLQRAINAFAGVAEPLKLVRVSTEVPRWARAVESGQGAQDVLFERGAGRWHVRDLIAAGANPDGGCAYAPAAVVYDLYKIPCPPWRALHAQRATRAQSAMLTRVFDADRTTRPDGNARFHLLHVCISRLNRRWAAAIAEFPDTGIAAWFHRRGSAWRVARYGRSGKLPARPIILSLAFCVGYSADQYGA